MSEVRSKVRVGFERSKGQVTESIVPIRSGHAECLYSQVCFLRILEFQIPSTLTKF